MPLLSSPLALLSLSPLLVYTVHKMSKANRSDQVNRINRYFAIRMYQRAYYMFQNQLHIVNSFCLASVGRYPSLL